VGLVDLPERAVRRFDDFQQDRWWIAFPVGAVRKYADDRGSALAALVTVQVFLGLLPLLVVALTVLGTFLEGSEDLRNAALDSTLAQFPVLGDRIRDDVSALTVSSFWVVVSILGLLWTAIGIYNSLQLTLNQVWNVEGVRRQGFVSRQARALALFGLVVGAAVGTAFVPDSVVSLSPDVVADVLGTVARVGVAAALLLGVFRLALSPSVPTRLVLPAALLAGLLWHLVQQVGAWLVVERLAEAEDLYGGIGFVVVVLFWINLLARALVFANEWAVVGWRQLWPRRIAQPPLTDADRRVLADLVRNERRRPEQHIQVTFDEPEEVP
jgi:YihY family inner membrane protein